MFSHPECEETKSGIVKIDVKGATLKAFLDSLILGPEMTDVSMALDMFCLAEKYNIGSLKHILVNDISERVDRSSCLNTLVVAFQHGEETLEKAAFCVLRENKAALTGSKEWQELVSQYPALINKLLLQLI